MILKKHLLLPFNLRRRYFAIPKQVFVHHSTVRKIGGKTVVNCSRNGQPSKFTQRTDHATLRDSAKHPRAALETLQVSVSMLNVRNQKRLKKSVVFWKRFQEKTFKMNIAAELRFAKLHLNKSQGFRNSLGQTRPKWRCLAMKHTSYQLSCTVVEG